MGEADGSTIIVDDRLNGVQMFCAVQHELVHIEGGHSRRQPEHIEAEVRYETARRCLTVEAMVGAWQGDLELTARRLAVTTRVLMDRAETFTNEEARTVSCDTCRACPAMKFRFAPVEAF